MLISDTKLPESSLAANHLTEVGTRNLLIGMYVYELDCPWSDTPFTPGGFHLRDTGAIEMLQKFCKSVTIDTNKGVEPARQRHNELTILSSARRKAPSTAAVKVKRDTYPDTHSIKKLIDKTFSAFQQLEDAYQLLAQSVREGISLDLKHLQKPSAMLIDSIIANPQAAIWILNTQMQHRTDSSYCVRAAIWATILARQVGLSRSDMDALLLGTLLSDIGMNLLPERLVNKRGKFRKKEVLAYRKHVDFGLELLGQYPDLSERIMRIVRCHHERHDGLGFPRKLRGDQIPVLARFASLAFSFERLLRNGCQSGNISPAKAIARLYKQRALKFPEQLVVEFIHVMGMYPVGTVVELSTGELAVVLEQNLNARLFPRVGLLTDELRNVLSAARIADLSQPAKSEPERSITSSVEPVQHGLDLSQYTFSFSGKRIGLGVVGFRV